MERDWLFHTDGAICNFRCAGLVIRNGKVLLQRDGDEYALIGGHVKVGETGSEAVIREFWEELGVQIRIEKMLWSEECFWTWQEKLSHTISFYYLAQLEDDSAISDDGAFQPQLDNPRVEIGWVPVDELKRLTVYPEFLKQRIEDLEPGHFITRA
ncbi:MAG: NUDIX domain-containing protein [Clostridia bacterium]|nr:NUDIX domain-containing protein [Clostridia bacterium]